MKVFISSDIEGTTGIVAWNETNLNSDVGDYFRKQMTREVAAAAQAAFDSGADDVLVKDAHDSARNIIPTELPQPTRLVRGWSGHPFCMMFGLDSSFDAVVFTGYHSAATVPGNPLSHTMDSGVANLTINGIQGSEFLINAYTAAYCNVPIAFVSGDDDLCQFAKKLIPAIQTVSTNKGTGNATISIHPKTACELIGQRVQLALQGNLDDCRLELPKTFDIVAKYKEHQRAYRSGFYPGAKQIDSTTIQFVTDDYFEALRMMRFLV